MLVILFDIKYIFYMLIDLLTITDVPIKITTKNINIGRLWCWATFYKNGDDHD